MDMSNTHNDGAAEGVEQSDPAEERMQQGGHAEEHGDAEEMPAPRHAPHDGTGKNFHDGTGSI